MKLSKTTELATGLRTMIEASEDGDHDAAIVAVCEAILAAGASLDIEQDDDGPDAMGGDSPLWVISTRRLTVDGEEVAEWTRCSMGAYGAGSHERHDADKWLVVEDTNGGKLPLAVEVALDALGIEDDDLPDVPEPDEADEVEDGDYAVLHKNDYAVSGGDTWGVVSRHDSEDDARRACEAKWRGFSAANTEGSYGPEWCVGVLEDGEWTPLASDDE